MGRCRRGPRAARAAGEQPAPDPACVRGHRDPHPDGRDPVRARHAGRVGGLPLEQKGCPGMRRLVALALVLALAALACSGEKKESLSPPGSKRVELMLDYFPNADHAPIYAAQSAGYFKQAGLDVRIRKPADPAAPIKQVAAGRVDLAISYEPEVLRARDRGLHV